MAEENVISVIIKSVDQMSADLKNVEGRLTSLQGGVDKTQDSLGGLTQSSKESGKALEVLNTAMTSVGAITGAVNPAFVRMAQAMTLFSRALPVAAIGAAIGGFVALAKSASDTGAQFARLSDLTQLSTTTLSGLAVAAEQNDSSIQEFAQSLSFLQRNLSNAARGMPEAVRLFSSMGFSIEDAKAGLKDFDGFVVKFGQRLFEFNDAADRMNLAVQLTGRGGRDTLNTFKALAEQGLAPFVVQAKALGIFISEDFAKKSREFNDDLNKTGLLFKGFAAIIAGPVISALSSLLDWYFRLAGIKIEPPDWKGILADAQRAMDRLGMMIGARLKLQGIDLTELIERGDFAEISRKFAELKLQFKIDPKTLADMQLFLNAIGDQNAAVAALTKSTKDLKDAERGLPDETQIKFQADLAKAILATASARAQLRFEMGMKLEGMQVEAPHVEALISQADIVAAAKYKELIQDIKNQFEAETKSLGETRALQLQSARTGAAQLEIEKLRRDTLMSIGDLAKRRADEDAKQVETIGVQRAAMESAQLGDLQEQLKTAQMMNAPLQEQLKIISDIGQKTKDQLEAEKGILLAKQATLLERIQEGAAAGELSAGAMAAKKEYDAINASIGKIETQMRGVLIPTDLLAKAIQQANLPLERTTELLQAQIPIYERQLEIVRAAPVSFLDQNKNLQEQVAILSQIDQLERQILENKIRVAEVALDLLKTESATKEQIAAQEQALRLLVAQETLVGDRVAAFYRQLAKQGQEAADSIAKDFVDKFVDFLSNANTKGGFEKFFKDMVASFGKTVVTSLLQAGVADVLKNSGLISGELAKKGGGASLSDLLMDSLKSSISKTGLGDAFKSIFGGGQADTGKLLSDIDAQLSKTIGDVGATIDEIMRNVPAASEEALAAIGQGVAGLATPGTMLTTSATQLATAGTSLSTAGTGLSAVATAFNVPISGLSAAAQALIEAAAFLKACCGGGGALKSEVSELSKLPIFDTTVTETGNRMPEVVITEEDITGQASKLEQAMSAAMMASVASVDFSAMSQSLTEALDNGISGMSLVDDLSDQIDDLADLFADVMGSVDLDLSESLQSLSSESTSIFSNLFAQLSGGFDSLIGGLSSGLSGLFSSFSSGFGSLFGGLFGGGGGGGGGGLFGGIGSGIMSAFSWIGGLFGKKGGEVPGGLEKRRFATGGKVSKEPKKTSSTGGEVPIIAHEGEFVVQRSAVENVGVDTMREINRTGELPDKAGSLTAAKPRGTPARSSARRVDSTAVPLPLANKRSDIGIVDTIKRADKSIRSVNIPEAEPMAGSRRSGDQVRSIGRSLSVAFNSVDFSSFHAGLTKVIESAFDGAKVSMPTDYPVPTAGAQKETSNAVHDLTRLLGGMNQRMAVSDDAIAKFRSGTGQSGLEIARMGEEIAELRTAKPAADRGKAEEIQQQIFLVDQRPPRLGPRDVVMLVSDDMQRGGAIAKGVHNVLRRGGG